MLQTPPPIVSVWQTFYDKTQPKPRTRGSRKSPGVKVDVVAENGHRWIRVNTYVSYALLLPSPLTTCGMLPFSVKNSRMLAEFRELDSYVTDSDSDAESACSSSSDHRPSLAPNELDNSLLRMGRSLVMAAQQNPVPGTNPPRPPAITLRLTRLDPSPTDLKEHDPRIRQTVDMLQEMGIDVQLGERDIMSLPRSAPKGRVAPRLLPTLRVNLDLSILIALVSDITHAPLPASMEEAEARFVPPPSYVAWKRERAGVTTDAEGSVKHSRALANQALQERSRGLLQDMHDRLAEVTGQSPPSFDGVEFWTTPEARDRCLRIVLSKIGGAGEQRRARALFASITEPAMDQEMAEEAYWHGSRYPRGFLPLLPVRIFPSDEPPEVLGERDISAQSDFSRQLIHTCKVILAEGSEAAVPSSLPLEGCEGEDEPIPRAATMCANPRLTAHTVRSLLWGAAKGWTTMTANRASVKAILREVKARGRAAATGLDAPSGQAPGEDDSAGGVEKAAIWVVDPRSLAEGMRSDLPSADGA